MAAYDSALPDDKAFATLIININRNLFPPEFEGNVVQYTASIKDYDPKGTFVVNINATDADATVSSNKISHPVCFIFTNKTNTLLVKCT